MAEPAIRIELVDRTKIRIRTLKPERLTRHGFGTFLERIEPREISITQEALDALYRCRYRHGLQGVEIFSHNVFSWGSTMQSLTVEINRISRHPGSEWLTGCCVVERTRD